MNAAHLAAQDLEHIIDPVVLYPHADVGTTEHSKLANYRIWSCY